MELPRITRQIHCKAVGQRATLIHRQYNRDWVTSYSRPPTDPYLTSPLLQNPGGATGPSDTQRTCVRACVYPVQLEVESASVADRLSVHVSSPQRRRGRLTVGTEQSGALRAGSVLFTHARAVPHAHDRQHPGTTSIYGDTAKYCGALGKYVGNLRLHAAARRPRRYCKRHAPHDPSYEKYDIVHKNGNTQRILLPERPRTTPYLSEHCIPVSGADTRRHLRSEDRHLLAVPRFRLNTYGRRAFSVPGSMAWNSISDFIPDPTSSIYCFRRLLKNVLVRYTNKSTHSLTHSEEGRATVTGNVQGKFLEVRRCSF